MLSKPTRPGRNPLTNMGLLRLRFRFIVRLVAACTLLSSAFSVSTRADADQWAEEFKAPFDSQIIGVLNGNVLPPPTADSAALRTVAGLHAGDPILIDASNDQQYQATVQT